MCRGTMAIGLWPLGYGRPLYSASGEIVGYTGKNARFHGADVGPNADKSENYSPAEFRQQLAAARMLAQRFTWVYCHAGSTLWQMTPAEIRRYHGTVIDAVPVADNLNEFLRVMREKRIIDDPLFAQAAAAVRERRPFPQYAGFPAAWRILGPMPHDRASFADGVPAFDGASPAARTVKPGPGGYVDLTRLLGKQGTPLAWGVTACVMPRTRRVWVRIGSNDYGAVFVNGRRIYRVKEERPAAVDDDSVAVTLPAGRSTIAVACGDAGGSQWGFCVRVTDARGSAVPGLRWVRP
jgi:hypothetical protein